MFPARFAPFAFGFVFSALMSLMVSGIATIRTAGMIDGFADLWLRASLPSWAMAFPVVLVIAPLTRRIVGSLVRA